MLKDFLLFIKYPYTAGIIAVIWLGSAALLALADNLQLVSVLLVDLLATIVIAIFGFNDQQEL